MAERDLIGLLEGLFRPRIAVLGDFMLDHYVWGEVERISPEAPVPVVHVGHEEHRLGGAGNVVANLTALGAQPAVFGLRGEDPAGESLKGQLEVLAATGGLLSDTNRPTTQKIRVMARNQQMIRVDREDSASISSAMEQELLKAVCNSSWDALVLSDYGKGVLTPSLIQAVIAEAQTRGVPCLVDPKQRDLSQYRGATVATPNRAEAEGASGCSLGSLEALEAEAPVLLANSGLDALLVTLGPEGMYLANAEGCLHLPTAARQVFDVTGAGDTVISMLAVALSSGLEWEPAIRLANAAAGLAVAKVGTTAVGREELLTHLATSNPLHKVVLGSGRPGLQHYLEELRREGRRVVFTNGCFDILHAGHVRYLQEARQMGDALIVGLNSDESVSRLKGPERPFNALEDRAEVLAGLGCVDLVVSFVEDTPEDLIREVCPQVLVKGGDWKEEGVVGADFVEAQGGTVKLVDIVPGRSTTGLAEKIRER